MDLGELPGAERALTLILSEVLVSSLLQMEKSECRGAK